MCGRCKCCNEIMEEWEMKSVDPLTGTYTELCDRCISDDLTNDDEISLDNLSEEDVL